MPLKTALYGDQPSRRKIILSNISFVFFGLCVYGWWTDFVPSLAWLKVGLSTSISLAIVFTTMCYIAMCNGELTSKPQASSLKPQASTAAKIIGVLIVPIMFFCMFYISITHGIADFATRALGNQRSLVVQLSKDYRSSGKSCSYRLVGRSIKSSMPQYLCISREAYDSLPKLGFYELQVRETPLGFHISTISVERDR